MFTIRGPGTVITGIPTRGRVGVGDTLTLLPAGRGGHVRRMQVYGEDASEARAGECVALNLPEIDHLEVRRGMVLCASAGPEPAAMAEAELLILDSVKGQLDDFIEAHLHIGTASVLARVAMLETTRMSAGQKQMVQLRLAEPLPLVPGERYVLRANLAGPGTKRPDYRRGRTHPGGQQPAPPPEEGSGPWTPWRPAARPWTTRPPGAN